MTGPTVRVDVLVAGSMAIDTHCDYAPSKTSSDLILPQAATSNPASITQNLGGVATNVATALHFLGTSVHLCSAVGGDILGSSARSFLADRNIESGGIITIPHRRTAQYISINDSRKDLVLGMADMNIMEQSGDQFPTFYKKQMELCKPSWLVLDANWDVLTLTRWIEEARSVGAKIAFEPVSTAKSQRLFGTEIKLGTVTQQTSISLSTPNSLELAEMHDAASKAEMFESDEWWRCINALGMSNSGERSRLVHITSEKLVDRGIPQRSMQLLPYIPTLLVKLGSEGVLLTQLLNPKDRRLTDPEAAPHILARGRGNDTIIGGVYMRLFPPAEVVANGHIRSVNGVGDTFMGVIIAGLSRQDPKPVDELIDIAQRGAIMTLKHEKAVSPEIASLKALL